MTIHIIIQARMTSTRLPGKVMLPLCGKTVLEIMLERLSVFKNNIILATTNDGTQEPIVELCKLLDIKYYEGDTDNVLSRYYEAAFSHGAREGDLIVRCTSDCPLIDAEVVQSVIDYYQQQDFDYVSASSSTGFPRGLDTEVFSFSLLKEVYLNASEHYEKEHVTPYIYKSHNERFKIGYYKSPVEASKYRITLDEQADYQAIQAIYKLFSCSTSFKYKELVSVLENNPEIYEINKQIEQKKIQG